MSRHIVLNFFAILLFLNSSIEGVDRYYVQPYGIPSSICEADSPPPPPPFEKIYVDWHEILTTPEGIFYVTPQGEREKVRALRTDCQGTYVILFLRQCPICNRYYKGDCCDEGFACPILAEPSSPL